MSSDIKAQNALDALTAGLLAGEDSENPSEKTDLPAAELAGFTSLIQSLGSALAPVEPSADFAESLRAELLGERQGVVKRVRRMPAGVQIAAALALAAGCLLVIMRRLIGSDGPQPLGGSELGYLNRLIRRARSAAANSNVISNEMQEEAVATPL